MSIVYNFEFAWASICPYLVRPYLESQTYHSMENQEFPISKIL